MAVVERAIQSIPQGKWDEFMEWENKWVPVMKRRTMGAVMDPTTLMPSPCR